MRSRYTGRQEHLFCWPRGGCGLLTSIAATGFLVGKAAGLSLPDTPPFINAEARLLLMVLVLGSVFTGAATSIQELVKDRVIYQRERAVGLSRVAYIGSKALVLGVAAGVVLGCASGTLRWGERVIDPVVQETFRVTVPPDDVT